MKRISLILVLLVSMANVFAQETDTWEGLVKKKAKSDEEITNPKKNIKAKTWESRGDLYYTISNFNTSGLYVGMPAITEGMNFGADQLVGTPLSKATEGDKEIWVYAQKKLVFIGGKLDSWEETDFIDPLAINKAAEAYYKADELDPKFRNKTTAKEKAALIRGGLVNKGIELYQKKDFKNAYDYLVLGLKIAEFPRTEADTAFSEKVLNYYAGIIGTEAGKYKDASKHFRYCIDNNYEAGMSFHYFADTYRLEGDSVTYEAKIKEGFEKYPNEEQIVIDLINFYISKNETDKVISYLDLALSNNPENPSYYSAKGSIYDNKFDELAVKFKNSMDSAIAYKKEAFRHRNDKPKEKEVFDKKRDAQAAVVENLKLPLNENYKTAEELYNSALQKEAKFFNALYNIGRMHYKMHEINLNESTYVYEMFKDDKKSDELLEKAKEELKNSSEYFKKAHEINPKDRTTLEILRSIYYKLKDKENELLYREKLDALGAESGIN